MFIKCQLFVSQKVILFAKIQVEKLIFCYQHHEVRKLGQPHINVEKCQKSDLFSNYNFEQKPTYIFWVDNTQ
jgi:hypothetical protein